jgi:hypothetical protein
MHDDMTKGRSESRANGTESPTSGGRKPSKPLGRPVGTPVNMPPAKPVELPLALPKDEDAGPFSPTLHAISPHSGSVVDRRMGMDRRALQSDTNLERRRGPGRRLTDFVKAAEEGEMNQEQFLFLMAIDAFKNANGKTFPTWTDVLEIIRKMGYRKTMTSELNLGPRAQDWTEKPDAPSGVWKEARDEESGFRKAG